MSAIRMLLALAVIGVGCARPPPPRQEAPTAASGISKEERGLLDQLILDVTLLRDDLELWMSLRANKTRYPGVTIHRNFVVDRVFDIEMRIVSFLAREESPSPEALAELEARVERAIAESLDLLDPVPPKGQYRRLCDDARALAAIERAFREGRYEDVLAEHGRLEPLPGTCAILPAWFLVRDEIDAAAQQAREILAAGRAR